MATGSNKTYNGSNDSFRVITPLDPHAESRERRRELSATERSIARYKADNPTIYKQKLPK